MEAKGGLSCLVFLCSSCIHPFNLTSPQFNINDYQSVVIWNRLERETWLMLTKNCHPLVAAKGHPGHWLLGRQLEDLQQKLFCNTFISEICRKNCCSGACFCHDRHVPCCQLGGTPMYLVTESLTWIGAREREHCVRIFGQCSILLVLLLNRNSNSTHPRSALYGWTHWDQGITKLEHISTQIGHTIIRPSDYLALTLNTIYNEKQMRL